MTSRALREATLLVMAALSRGTRHGYGIITEVQEISGGRVTLRAGTLYAALDHLRAAGLIGVDREEVTAGRFRRYYRLIHSASGPDLRVGDAEREAAAAALAEHYAQGRLTFDELGARLHAALTATVRSDLARAARDLPHP